MVDGLHVGVDVGGTRVRLISQDERGMRSDIVQMAVPRTADSMVDAVVEAARVLASGRAIASVAIGLPGQTGAQVPIWIPNLRFLDGYPLADAIAGRLDCEATLLNDADATLMAESHEGAAVGQSNVLLLTFGTGIGGAIQVDGKPVRGRSGCAGSFGWLSIGDAEPVADHGQWERLASGTALEALAAPWGGVSELLQDARGGWPIALGVIDSFGTLIGRGLAALASIFDPDVIVFSGGLTRAFDVLEEPINAARVAYASPAGQDVPLVVAMLGANAGVIGALHAAMAATTKGEEYQWMRQS